MKLMLISISLFILAALAYSVIMKMLNIQWTTKRKRLSSVLQENEQNETENPLVKWLQKKGLFQYVSPVYMIEQAQKYGVNVTKRSYLITFLLGTGIGILVFFIYFQPILYLLPLSLIGGIMAINIRLHKIKKEYISLLNSKVSIYMSSLSTALMTFTNIKDALMSILPSLEEPVKSDVEGGMLQLQDGKDARIAFAKMNHKYPQREIRLFHDQLDVVLKGGNTDIETLRKIAFKMKKKETYSRKIKSAHKTASKAWRVFVFLPLSAPFLFVIYSMDNYFLIMNHLATSFVYALAFLAIFITYRKLELLELYDPTSDESADVA